MEPRDWIYLFSVLIAFSAFGAGLIREAISSYSELRSAKRSEIHKKLNEFYAPLLMYLEVMKQLNLSFKGGADFRILEELLKGNYPEGNDSVLLEQIIEVERDVEKLIIGGAGWVDKDLFSPLTEEDIRRSTGGSYENVYEVLQDLLVHMRILRLAARKELRSDIESFKKYVYPRVLDRVVEDKVLELKSELSKLNRSVIQRLLDATGNCC